MLKLPVVILCGGLATRLRPITEKIPKSLIEVADQPFIHHQLALLSSQGIKEVYLCIGYLGERIQEFVKDGKQYGLKVFYSQDGDQLLGTGGSIKKLLKKYPLTSFFILYGDSYLSCNFLAIENSFFKNLQNPLMTVYKNNNNFDKSNVDFDGTHVTYYSKIQHRNNLNYIDYGLSILRNSDFNITADQFDLSKILEGHVEKNILHGFEVTDRFYEIGSSQGIQETDQFIRDKK